MNQDEKMFMAFYVFEAVRIYIVVAQRNDSSNI